MRLPPRCGMTGSYRTFTAQSHKYFAYLHLLQNVYNHRVNLCVAAAK